MCVCVCVCAYVCVHVCTYELKTVCMNRCYRLKLVLSSTFVVWWCYDLRLTLYVCIQYYNKFRQGTLTIATKIDCVVLELD